MEIFTVSFFGHRNFYLYHQYEKKLIKILKELLNTKEYVDFLVGRNGEFDIFVSSSIRKVRKELWDCNSSLILILPYITMDYEHNKNSYEEYYDEIQVCHKSLATHYKSAIQTRNREIVDKSDLVVCYIEKNNGGAYQTIKYALKSGKQIINIADVDLSKTKNSTPENRN